MLRQVLSLPLTSPLSLSLRKSHHPRRSRLWAWWLRGRRLRGRWRWGWLLPVTTARPGPAALTRGCKNPPGYPLEQWGVSGQFGWVRFIVVCFLYKTNPNPRKTTCCGKKWPMPVPYLGLGWPWVGDFVGFHEIYMSSNPAEFGVRVSQTP